MTATDTVPSREATVRSLAVELVDARYGYTYEFDGSPNAHLIEYDEEEARLSAVFGDYDVRGHGLGERPCLARTSSGAWAPALVLQDTTLPGGDHAALVRCLSVTRWLRRDRGGDLPDEWMYPQ